MRPPDDYERAFVDALLNPQAATPGGLTERRTRSAARGFAIYRNNVFSCLIDVLQTRFPVCQRLVGERFFAGAAREFVRCSPPSSPVLSEYGGTFPDFIRGFEPARELPYLPDVAELELNVGRSFDAADASPLSLEEFSSLSAEQIVRLKLRFHPSLILQTSAYPIVSIWRTNTFDDRVEALDATIAEDALIVRPDTQVEVRRIPSGGVHFIRLLVDGLPLSAAANAARAESASFDLAACVTLLFSARAIIAITPADDNARVGGPHESFPKYRATS